MNRIKLKMDSRQDLRGRLFVALQPLAIIILVSYAVGIFGTLATQTNKADLAIALNIIDICLSIAYAVIYFSLTVGVCRFYLKFIKGESSTWATVFEDLKAPKTFLQEFIAYLLASLLIALGLVLLVIPGIYLALRYSQMSYIFAEQPKTKWRDAMTRSADLLKGHYWEIFALVLSFFWWYVLIGITLGLASLYVVPYLNCVMARYYKSLCNSLDGESNDVYGDTFNASATYNSPDNSNPFDDTIYGTTVKPPKSEDDNPFEF